MLIVFLIDYQVISSIFACGLQILYLVSCLVLMDIDEGNSNCCCFLLLAFGIYSSYRREIKGKKPQGSILFFFFLCIIQGLSDACWFFLFYPIYDIE